ncbi:hypothetical protein AAG906_031862 [Vitis piasezkii]
MKLQSHNHLKLTTLLLNYAEHFQTKQLLQIQAQLITNPPLSLHPNLIAVKLIGASHLRPTPKPQRLLLNAIIKAHINCGAWEHALNSDGLKVHAVVIKSGFDNNIHLGTSLVDMYFKFREPASAGQVFDEMPLRDVVSWNTMVSGYCLCGDLESARRVLIKCLRGMWFLERHDWRVRSEWEVFGCDRGFHEMQKVGGVVPDDVTLVSVLSACAHVGALDFGRWIDRFCGTMEEARRIFDGMRERDVISWSTMICGSGTHGDADSIWLFSRMIQEYRIVPKVGHYGCVIDLLSRAGRLDEAEDLINLMPIEPNVIVWGALLGGCRIHKDFRRGNVCMQRLLELDSEYTGSYVDDAANCWLRMQHKGIIKDPGCSKIEVHNTVHEFKECDNASGKDIRYFDKQC